MVMVLVLNMLGSGVLLWMVMIVPQIRFDRRRGLCSREPVACCESGSWWVLHYYIDKRKLCRVRSEKDVVK